MMSSVHQKKTDSTDKIAVFYSDDGPGSKGLSVSYFEEYALIDAIFGCIKSVSMDLLR